MRVTVVGPGRMGVGIVQALAIAGQSVDLVDLKERSAEQRAAALESARREVETGLTLLASIGVFGGDADIAYPSDAEAVLSQASIVFEAVPETAVAKTSTYRRLDVALAPAALLGSTTSTFGVDELASQLSDPSRFMNTHWLNPAALIPLVEVMPADTTSEPAVEEMTAFLRRVGKVPVRCAASAGYIVPRIQALAMNEAARLVEEGVADAEAIDTACRLGFGVRFATMGLLEFVDWGGADILLYASDYLTRALGSDRYSAPEIVRDKVEAGELGMKTGRGFYDVDSRGLEEYQREKLRALAELLAHLRR